MAKSTPNLPASSRMKMPSGGGPQIKNALKAKALGMEYFIYEQEKYNDKGVIVNAKESSEYLKKMKL